MSEAPTRRSASSWVLAFLLLVVIDAAVTRTPLLWAETSFERPGPLPSVFGQTFTALRSVYATPDDGALDVALLGNSRLQLATGALSVEREVDRLVPDRTARAHMIAVFGGGPVVFERFTRHLPHLDPDVVVLAISPSDLSLAREEQTIHPASRLLEIGFSAGPGASDTWPDRVDRWLRSTWRLWRFREFARQALGERILGADPPAPRPPPFDTRLGLLRFVRGDALGETAERMYRDWLGRRDLEGFVAYLEATHPDYLEEIRRRAPIEADPADLELSREALEALFARCAARGWPTLVLLMPENPILAQDREGLFHRPGQSDALARGVAEAASRHDLRFVDGRDWMSADQFMDFDHLWLDLSGFAEVLAPEIARAFES